MVALLLRPLQKGYQVATLAHFEEVFKGILGRRPLSYSANCGDFSKSRQMPYLVLGQTGPELRVQRLLHAEAAKSPSGADL